MEFPYWLPHGRLRDEHGVRVKLLLTWEEKGVAPSIPDRLSLSRPSVSCDSTLSIHKHIYVQHCSRFLP